MNRPTHITPLHVERGIQIRSIVKSDIVRRGLSFEAAVESLAEDLGIQVESVKLAIAIANEWGDEATAPAPPTEEDAEWMAYDAERRIVEATDQDTRDYWTRMAAYYWSQA